MKELIAKRLITLRGEASREETAHAIGISVSALQMYENTQRIPRDIIKIRIANHFKKSVQEIFLIKNRTIRVFQIRKVELLNRRR